ncbi:MAG: hypothetical protein HYX44_05980 [Aquabacterium sp.]|nr:hypothetical protein [Aquabacterium sp.]
MDQISVTEAGAEESGQISSWRDFQDRFRAAMAMAATLASDLTMVDSLRLNEPLHGTGVWTRDKGVLRTWLGEIDVNLQRSHEALPPTTLGL